MPTSKSQTTRTALTTDPLSIGILTITKRLALKAGITATDPSSTDILTITYSLALQANITGTDPSSMDIPIITKRQAGKSNLTAMALSDMDIQVITCTRSCCRHRQVALGGMHHYTVRTARDYVINF